MAADDVSISDRLSKPTFSIVCFIIMSVTHSLITAVVMVEAGRAYRLKFISSEYYGHYTNDTT